METSQKTKKEAMTRAFPRVKTLRAYVAQTTSQGADCHDVGAGYWIDGTPTPIANPMSCYKQYSASRKSWGINALGTLVVEVEAEDGTTGVGVTIGGQPGRDHGVQSYHRRTTRYISRGSE